MNINLLNDKLLDAIQQKSKIQPEEDFLKSTCFGNMFKDLKHFQKMIAEAEIVEYTSNHFNKTNLHNANYNNLQQNDYEKFFYLCGLINPQRTTGHILSSVVHGATELPVILKGTNNVYHLLNGNIEFLAYKVLGLFPLVREVKLDVDVI